MAFRACGPSVLADQSTPSLYRVLPFLGLHSLRPGNTSGGRPHLPVLLCSTNGQVSEAIERLQESRPGLDVVRRAADTGEGGLMR